MTDKHEPFLIGQNGPYWNPKLLSCPFCGGEAHAAPSGATGAVIRCGSCSARTVSDHGVLRAAEEWNKRTIGDKT